jgi:hypothetical protein
VQGTLEGAEIVVLSSASIASTKEVELSTNFLELIREAGKRDADWQATMEAALKRQNGDSEVNVAEEFEVKDLEIPYRPWTPISMNSITAPPESDGFTQIWVIVDRLTKMAHFIPLRVSEGSSESPVEDLAKCQIAIRGSPHDSGKS